jgi:HSP20 family protein
MSTLNSLLHPHHVSLIPQPHNLQSFFQYFNDHFDSYHGYNHISKYKGLLTPRFNITELETNYLLEGELPGVSDKTSINIRWLHNQVLVIDGEIKPTEPETTVDPMQARPSTPELNHKTENAEGSNSQPEEPLVETTAAKPKHVFPQRLLNERRLGTFQRSFTFPDQVSEEEVGATLKDGLLSIVVPKSTPSVVSGKRVYIK